MGDALLYLIWNDKISHLLFLKEKIYWRFSTPIWHKGYNLMGPCIIMLPRNFWNQLDWHGPSREPILVFGKRPSLDIIVKTCSTKANNESKKNTIIKD